MKKVTFTKQTKMQLESVSLSIGDIQTLIPVVQMGLPDTIPSALKEVIECLVCQSINQLRPGIETVI